MKLAVGVGDSRGKQWDDGLKCYLDLIQEHPFGCETRNYHKGGSSSGTEHFYTVQPYGQEPFPLEVDGLLTQIQQVIADGINPDTVVINSTGNDQLIIAEMYPVDSVAEGAVIDAQHWVKDKRAEYLSDNPDADQVQIAYDLGWNGYSKHKLGEAIRTLKYHLPSARIIVIGPLGWEESPLANMKGFGNAQTTRIIYTYNMRVLCEKEGAGFLDVSDIQGPWKTNEGDAAIHLAQEGHTEIARRLMGMGL